jgi:hypothetical protein
MRTLALLFALVGTIFVVGGATSGQAAAVLSGAVAMAVAGWVLRTHASVRTELDRENGVLTVTESSLALRPRVATRRLADVAAVEVETRQGTEGDVHLVVIALRSGERFRLDHEGGVDRAATEREADRIRRFLAEPR